MDEHGRYGRTHDERGSAVVWMMLVMGVCMLVLGLIGRSADEAGDVARLQSTADLAALAAVDGGRAAAARVAHRNGAELRSFDVIGATVTVEVSDLGVTATATAEPDAHLTEGPDPIISRGGS